MEIINNKNNDVVFDLGNRILGYLNKFEVSDSLGEIWVSNKPWTRELKTRLYEICTEMPSLKPPFQNLIATSGMESPVNSEWLYDFTFYSMDGSNTTNIILAAEIEWGLDFEDDILFDFEKLIQARSDYRLMIFQAANNNAIAEIFEKLKDSANRFKHSQNGDKYLLAGWSQQPNEWKFKTCSYTLNK
jgi:hypothetical protein